MTPSIKRPITALLVALLGTSALFAAENGRTRKTYLATRPAGMNLPLEYSSYHHLIHHKTPNSHTRMQATGFYSDSQNSKSLGRYFGVGNGSNSFRIGTFNDAGKAAASVPGGEIPTETIDVDGDRLLPVAETIVDPETNPNKNHLSGVVTFRPRQELWGVRFELMQDINCPCDSFFFTLSVPVVNVSNRMGLKIKGDTPAELYNDEATLANFFAGKVENIDPDLDVNGDAQNDTMIEALQYGKIDGKHRSKTGVADVRLGLGYRFIHSHDNHLSLQLQLSIPTGNKPHAAQLFEPVYGTRHVGLGGQLDAHFNVWQDDCCQSRVDFMACVQYQYLFEATEKRTLSLKDHNMGHYFAVGALGLKQKPLFPAANILTRDLKVKPGSHIDALANISFCSSGFMIDVGYNLFWKDRESVHLKKAFEENTWGVPNKSYITSDPEELSDGPTIDNVDLVLGKDTIDVKACATPTYLTHTVYGGIGYEFGDACSCANPFIGIGGAYEFASEHNEIERYTLWAKLGVRF